MFRRVLKYGGFTLAALVAAFALVLVTRQVFAEPRPPQQDLKSVALKKKKARINCTISFNKSVMALLEKRKREAELNNNGIPRKKDK